MPGGTGGIYRRFGYEQRTSRYVSRWWIEFAKDSDRVRRRFLAQAGPRPSCELEFSCHRMHAA
jgi:hypothetical protein